MREIKKVIKFLVMGAYMRGWVSARLVVLVFAKFGLKAN